MDSCIPKSNDYKKGLVNSANHKHKAVDIIEDDQRLFISRSLYDKLISLGEGSGGEITGKINPINILWDTKYRYVTDLEKLAWNSKAEKQHSHSAAQITESETKSFISQVERTDWNEAKNKITGFGIWQQKIVNENTDNTISIGNKQLHQFFIFRYIAKTVAATEFNTIFIDYTPDTDLVTIVGNIYNGAFVGIENVTPILNPNNSNLIDLVFTVGNTDIKLFKYNIELIKL